MKFVIFLLLAFGFECVASQGQHLQNPGLQNLLRKKSKIEDLAYVETLGLCVGYRIASGNGSLPHIYSGKKIELLNELSIKKSLEIWASILSYGVAQPYSAIGGIKSDLISAAQSGLGDKLTWFGSVEAHFLTASDGFLKAARHCLNTVNEKEILKFANTIRLADDIGSSLGHASLFVVGTGLVNFLTQIIKRAAFLINSATNLRRSKVTSWIKENKVALKYLSESSAVMGLIQLSPVVMVHLEKDLLTQKAAVDALFNLVKEGRGASQQEWDRRMRFRNLLSVYKKFKALRAMYQKGDCELCPELESDLVWFVGEKFDDDDFEKLRFDLSESSSEEKISLLSLIDIVERIRSECQREIH